MGKRTSLKVVNGRKGLTGTRRTCAKNCDRYAPYYAPMDPADFGGAAYGESLWLTGAASDGLSALLGADDGCCGETKPNEGPPLPC